MTDRVAEFIVSDAGGVTLSVRPALPFLPDEVRLTGSGVEIHGDAKRLVLSTDPEVIAEIREMGGLLLLEHSPDTDAPPRELELLLSD